MKFSSGSKRTAGTSIVMDRGMIYKHPIKKGRVVIPRHPGKELATGTLQSILKAAEL